MSNKQNDLIYDRLIDLGIDRVLCGKLGFGITDLDLLQHYAQYFESQLAHYDFFISLDHLKRQVRADRKIQAIQAYVRSNLLLDKVTT